MSDEIEVDVHAGATASRSSGAAFVLGLQKRIIEVRFGNRELKAGAANGRAALEFVQRDVDSGVVEH